MDVKKSPMIIDSQSIKTTEKRGLVVDRMQSRKLRAVKGIF